MPKGQRKYNGAQKVEIVKQIRNEKLSFYEASTKYGISRRTLQDWERIYLEKGEIFIASLTSLRLSFLAVRAAFIACPKAAKS